MRLMRKDHQSSCPAVSSNRLIELLRLKGRRAWVSVFPAVHDEKRRRASRPEYPIPDRSARHLDEALLRLEGGHDGSEMHGRGGKDESSQKRFQRLTLNGRK